MGIETRAQSPDAAVLRRRVIKPKTLVGAAVFIFLSLTCAVRHATAALVPTVTNVVYGQTANGEPLLLDLYVPATLTGKQPVVVYIHGGSWAAGSKLDVPEFLANQTSFILASINYRLTKSPVAGNNTSAARWPAQIQDVRAAIRFVKSLAGTPMGTGKATIDPNRVGLYGFSAGAHLAAYAALTANESSLDAGASWSPPLRALDQWSGINVDVRTVVAVSGPYDLTWLYEWALMNDFYNADPSSFTALLLGGPVKDNMDRARQASPTRHVSGGSSPFLLVHGGFDSTVPPRQSTDFYNLLRSAGVPAQLQNSLGSHSNPPFFTDATIILEFLKATL